MISKYLTKYFWYNILIAIGIVVLLLLIVQWSLKSYTRHGEGIAVPDLKGLTLDQSKEVLDKLGLELQVMDSIFDTKQPPLSVVEQNPKASSKVKSGRTIYLVVNATNAPTTELPELVGRSSYKYAKMQLESYGLVVGEPIYKPDPHLNAVIGVLVNGRPATRKTKVTKGTVITLILGDGLGGGEMSVPYLLGLRYDEAEFKLKGYSLNVGAVIVNDDVTDTTSAFVFKQEPAFGSGRKIKMGESIDLFLSKDMPEGVDPSLYDVIEIDTASSVPEPEKK